MDYNSIIDFWFDAKTKPLWFNSTIEFDEQLQRDFSDIFLKATNNALKHWEEQPFGALALVIILDQFPLNMFRGQAESFSTESLSREITENAINKGFDAELTIEQRAFLYLPYMHSENIDDQEKSLILFNQPGLENNFKFAQHHYGIIKKFGRFPHRNEILGRESTSDEVKYLNSDRAFKG